MHCFNWCTHTHTHTHTMNASRRVVIGLHVVHLKSFNARQTADYPLQLTQFKFPFSLECYKLFCIYKIHKVTKTKVFLKVKTRSCLPKSPHSNKPPKIDVTVLDDLHNTTQMFTRRKKATFILAVVLLSWRCCVFTNMVRGVTFRHTLEFGQSQRTG